MKKIGYFLLLALSVTGAIGGIGYACYNNAYVISLGVAVLAWLAWPRIKELATKITL